jgi:hypothetical protein
MFEIQHFTHLVDPTGYVWAQPGGNRVKTRFRKPWNKEEEKFNVVLIEKSVTLPKGPPAKIAIQLGLKAPRRTVQGDIWFSEVSPTKRHSGLFLTFASLFPRPEQIEKFAGEHGKLFDDPVAEPFAEWAFEVRTMAFLIKVWESIKKKNLNVVMPDNFKIGRSGNISLPFANTIMRYDPWGTVRSIQPGTTVGGYFQDKSYTGGVPGPPIRAAKVYLLRALNARLDALSAKIAIARNGSGLSINLLPHNLLGALWFQFAAAVAADKDYRECKTCGTMFELSPDVNRTSRWYCDDACRVKAYRKRQSVARQMRKAGKSLKEISKATESDVATIKAWLKPKGE